MCFSTFTEKLPVLFLLQKNNISCLLAGLVFYGYADKILIVKFEKMALCNGSGYYVVMYVMDKPGSRSEKRRV